MRRLSDEAVNEILWICERMDSADIQPDERERLFQRLETIYDQFFNEASNNKVFPSKKPYRYCCVSD
ncbi:hypothetical protein P22_1041 [Propionispora sp. 2/2-37]|uniref:hypothetical protein n=1 Tax=Propionispora sp. 2/2-37 TaxID=1677858 RepID=UPI0006BB99DA|nr:hypothetical protein [Propionispora sp. 2/2-37]CUH94972.1 hypothetical protein P22_1041 [Propionispora sp. 2/2-37]